MEGELQKKASGATGMMRLWRSRLFVLTTRRLFYCEVGKSAAPKGVMPLEDIRQVEEIQEKKARCPPPLLPLCRRRDGETGKRDPLPLPGDTRDLLLLSSKPFYGFSVSAPTSTWIVRGDSQAETEVKSP